MPISIFFSDDSRQAHPSRPGMHPLVATGVIRVAAENIREINSLLNGICVKYGFPPGQEFKWSPGPDLWMHDNLVAQSRRDFFFEVLSILQDHGVVACVIIEDCHFQTATNCDNSHEMDVTNLLLERIERQCERSETDGLVIVDRPSGDRRDEDKFLRNCLETIQSGTDYLVPEHIIHNVVSSPSHLSRFIQAADLVTGCSLAFVSGENTYSPEIFDHIRPILDEEGGRIGGVGLKIHPDGRYLNLYHWLVRDRYCVGGGTLLRFPHLLRPYKTDPNIL